MMHPSAGAPLPEKGAQCSRRLRRPQGMDEALRGATLEDHEDVGVIHKSCG